MSTDSRKSRISESRLATDRRAEIRKSLQMLQHGKLYIDPVTIPDGVEYSWVRESCLGQHDPYRITYMAKRGYTPVPSDRHPEFPTNERGYIYREGQVLCERPKEWREEEQGLHNKETLEAMRTVPGQEHFMEDMSMPKKVLHNEVMLERHLNPSSFAE